MAFDEPKIPSIGSTHGVKIEFRTLTSLRGIAAMAVVIQHFTATAQDHARGSVPSLVGHGYLAVDLFFCLSGFIMAYSYADKFSQGDPYALKNFLINRAARIVPLNLAVLILFQFSAWLSVAMVGTNIIFQTENPIGDFVANAFMLQGLGVGRNLNGPSWSISTEFAAYFCFPLMLALALTPRRWLAVLATVVSLSILCTLAASQPRLGLAAERVSYGVIRCFTEFYLGLMAYRLFRSDWATRLARGSTLTLLMACLSIGMLARVDLFVVLLFPFLIAALAAIEEHCPSGRITQLLSNSVLHWLGLVSFSTYLLHQLFRPTALALLRALHPEPLEVWQALVFTIAASFVVLPFAWVAYRTVEQPGRRLVKRLSRPPPSFSASRVA